ncbi:MAG: hypothetical protein IKC64_02605, partial [Clostridia bacterium]|nr:hypothetical protein [Clostridia bacterium]
DKRVKNENYAVILIAKETQRIKKFAWACRVCGYPVFVNSCPFDREKTVGYFVEVGEGYETKISLCAGIGSCYGAKTDFIYDTPKNAQTIYARLVARLDKLNEYAKVSVTRNGENLSVTVTAFCQDKFEWAIMDIAKITAEFCPVVKVNYGYDAIEQEYGVVNALADLNYSIDDLIISDEFIEQLSLAKGKLYCKITVKEEETLKVLADTIITITTEAMK